jgi:2,3-dihydroxy-p-cumate/2,3-dihydroxybenzoate 3,4-dioxygenase
LGTQDLSSAIHYATDVLGLMVADSSTKMTAFRSDSKAHTLCYFQATENEHISAFEVSDLADLHHAANVLERQGIAIRSGSKSEAELRCVQDFFQFTDLSGNVIELVYGLERSGVRYYGARDAGVTGFSHIGLRTLDARRDEAFWTSLMGAKVSDRIGEAPLLRIDDVHHKIALFPSSYAGIQHINHQVESIDDLMRAFYLLQEKNIPIRFGPGRHPTSGAQFLYFAGPDGMIYEYSTGVKVFSHEEEQNHQPRFFPAVFSSFCMWGSKPDIAEFKK